MSGKRFRYMERKRIEAEGEFMLDFRGGGGRCAGWVSGGDEIFPAGGSVSVSGCVRGGRGRGKVDGGGGRGSKRIRGGETMDFAVGAEAVGEREGRVVGYAYGVGGDRLDFSGGDAWEEGWEVAWFGGGGGGGGGGGVGRGEAGGWILRVGVGVRVPMAGRRRSCVVGLVGNIMPASLAGVIARLWLVAMGPIAISSSSFFSSAACPSRCRTAADRNASARALDEVAHEAFGERRFLFVFFFALGARAPASGRDQALAFLLSAAGARFDHDPEFGWDGVGVLFSLLFGSCSGRVVSGFWWRGLSVAMGVPVVVMMVSVRRARFSLGGWRAGA